MNFENPELEKIEELWNNLSEEKKENLETGLGIEEAETLHFLLSGVEMTSDSPDAVILSDEEIAEKVHALLEM